jgi:uncharacterized protein YybS (DUF2232 family)
MVRNCRHRYHRSFLFIPFAPDLAGIDPSFHHSHAPRAGWAVAGVSAILVALLFNVPILFFFIIQFALVGVLVGEGLRKKTPVVPLLFVVPLVATLLILALGAAYYNASETTIAEMVKAGGDGIRLAVEENARKYQLDPEELMRYRKAVDDLITFVKVAFPALIFINVLSIVSLNLAFALPIADRLGLDRSHVPPLRELSIPPVWVWGLIISGFIFLLNVPYLKWPGLNAVLIFLMAYLIQGYSILSFFLKRTKLPGIVIGIIYLLFLLHPVLILLLCLAGLFETWFNFRKRASA